MTQSDTGLAVGIILSLGSIISFLPQYYKIIKHGNVDGISHWSQGLNNISAFCAFFGAFMLDYQIFRDCSSNPTCGRDLMPFIQLFFVWICPLVNYIIFIKYFNKNYISFSGKRIQEHHKVWGFFAFYVIVFLFCFTMTTIVLVANWESWEEHGILFGRILSILSTVITSFVWIPQIANTWKTKEVGSLSLLSLGIQSIGSFIIFIYQVEISNASWYIGIPYLVSSSFQAFLLVLGLIFNRRKRLRIDQLYAIYHDGDVKLTFLSDDEMEQQQLFDEDAVMGEYNSI